MYTKKDVLKKYKENFYWYFNIHLDDNTVYFENDLHINLCVPYTTNAEKVYIYECLNKLIDVFDFSFTLEYETIQDLENCTIIN